MKSLTIRPEEAIGAVLSDDLYDPNDLDADGRPIMLGRRGDKITREMIELFEEVGLDFVNTNQGLLVLNALRVEDDSYGVSDMRVRKTPQGLWPSQQITINGKVKEVKYSPLGVGGKGYTLDTWWKSFREHGSTGFVGRYI